MKKIICSIAGALLVFTNMLSPASAAQLGDVPAEVRAVALNGLDTFKNAAIPEPAHFNFANKEEVLNATISEGHQLHYVDPAKLKSGKTSSLLAVSKTVDAWKFIVYAGDVQRGSMIVAREDGIYKTVEFGGDTPDLGIALSNFRKLRGAKGIQGKEELVQFGPTFYLVGKSGNKEWVLPAFSQGSVDYASNLSYDGLYDSEPIVNSLKEKQEEYDSSSESQFGGAPTGTPTTSEQAAAPPAASNMAESNEGTKYLTWGIALIGALLAILWVVRTR